MSLVALFQPVCDVAGEPVFNSTPAAQSELIVDEGSTRKICQIVGEIDRERSQPTINRTERQYGFWGTDLGASFEHEGELRFLFGDTHPVAGIVRPRDSDLIAASSDTDPSDCLRLSFQTDADGGYRPLRIPGVDLGAFSVPTGGFSTNGRIYVFATTDFAPDNPMGRSVLARSDDDGRTFRRVRDVSTAKFINVAPVLVDDPGTIGLPDADAGPVLLMWASARYRQSAPYLAYAPVGAIENPSSMRFFAGIDPATGAPAWSDTESDSAPLFDEYCLGEISVAWNPHLARWLMLYNCGTPQKIYARAATQPWGPWSPAQVVFDPDRDHGFCHFMNRPPLDDGDEGCIGVSDPHSRQQPGDAYGPYLIGRFSRAASNGGSIVHFLMSTWNPYTVVLMQSSLRVPQEITTASTL